MLQEILPQTYIPGGFPMSKPFDPREQDIETEDSRRRAIEDCLSKRREFTNQTGVPVDFDGQMLLTTRLENAVRAEQVQRLSDQDVLKGLIRKYGLNRILIWARNLDAQDQRTNDTAQGAEVQ